MATVLTRTIDHKGRVTLPKGFADHLVIIEQVNESEIHITKAQAIPENETWLWRNKIAAGMVLQGIEEARAGQLVSGPDLDADAAETPRGKRHQG